MNRDTYCALNHGWNLDRYVDGGNVPKDDDNDTDEAFTMSLELVDNSITDPFWQSYWRMLRRVAKVILQCISWAEGCCCHEGILRGAGDDFDSDEEPDGGEAPLPQYLVEQAKKCPLRGRRCAELAAGDFDKHYQCLFRTQLVKVLQELDVSLSESQRFKILADFERARAHMASIFVIKLSHWRLPPYLLFGIGHYKPATALAIFDNAMGMNSGHAIEHKLMSSELQAGRGLFQS